MYRFCLYFFVAFAVLLASSLVNGQTTVCTGYPKMYNGLPCASTTRYWDGQMGACGCGTGNTDPFSWQWTLPTAAASAPIFGSATWCGTGCGKCYQLTPTAIGASPEGTGAPSLTSVIVKITNLCPYTGNEVWCAYDINSFGYDAHFDLMDYNMDGLITSMGWNNPEVTYEEVDCAASGYVNWGCECADEATSNVTTTVAPTQAPTTAPTQPATSAPTTAPTQAPTAAPTTQAATANPSSAATSAPTEAAAETTTPASTGSSISIQVNGGSNAWWFGLSFADPSVVATIATVEIMDSGVAIPNWSAMSFQGNEYWNMYSILPGLQITAPLSLRFTATDGTVATASNIISSFQAATINTGVAV